MGPLRIEEQSVPKEDSPMLRKCVMGLLALGVAASPAGAQTVDELIAKNLEARGGLDKLKAVKTLRLSGKMTMGPGMEAPVILELKRPNSVRMEFTFQGMTGVQAYDGASGWMITPFGGKTDPEPMSPEDARDAEEQSDLDGPLVDYKSKGHTVELVGKEKVEGSDAYKLKVTLKNGTVNYTYLDADSYLTIREESRRTVRGSEVEVESTIGDYKDVGGGLLMPHSIENGTKGQPQKQNILVEKVELNPPLDDARFKMPAPAKAEPPKQD
jgi:outer membrane lipoprotein-sorting protein